MATIHLENDLIYKIDDILNKINKVLHSKIKRTQYIRDAILEYNKKEYNLILKKQYEMASKLTKEENLKILAEFEQLDDQVQE